MSEVTINQKTQTVYTPYLATAIAEGFCEGEDATEEQQVEAYAYLIKSGMAWRLQGTFGRTATQLIENEIISPKGVINWEAVTEVQSENH